ncbi:MAG: AMP-binding protein [Bacteroidales bacterium]|nr:AMP-binding protein [Bacteroidales bacterium]
MRSLADFLKNWNNDSDTIAVHSSGSTGTPKIMYVEKKRMLASAKITCDFLHLHKGDTALLCMSLNHIGAQMVVVRSIERGMHLVEVPPCGHPLANLDKSIDFAAMVPLQIYNTLQVPQEKERLKQIKQLIIGGGSMAPEIEEELRSFPNAVWSTYGMTETLSHIALRRVNGDEASEWYTPLNNVRIRLNENDCLCILVKNICDNELITNDIATINNQGQFKIIGRRDNIINSGGLKIQIEEIEQKLHELGEKNFAIGSYPDKKFGQIVVLLTDGKNNDTKERISQLPPYWQPKRIVYTTQIPLTENGKIARQKVQEEIKNSMEHEANRQ